MLQSQPASTSPRSVFYLLTNIDEHPEVLSLANSIVSGKIREASELEVLSAHADSIRQDTAALPELLAILDSSRFQQDVPWHGSGGRIEMPVVKSALTQYAPTALLSGCWLQGVLRVAMAATPEGSRLAKIYHRQLQRCCNGKYFINEYQELHRQLVFPLPDISSGAFAEIDAFRESSFTLPSFLLSIGQFPRAYLPELLGVQLGWQYLGLSEVGPTLIRDSQLAHLLSESKMSGKDKEEMETDRELALDAVERTLIEQVSGERDAFWARICTGAFMVSSMWSELSNCMRDRSDLGPASIRENMLAMISQKAPHGFGYHGDKRIAGQRIDSLLSPDNFGASEVLDNLARSKFVVPGAPEKSVFCNNLVEWGGPMHSVFSPSELTTIRDWVLSLVTVSESDQNQSEMTRGSGGDSMLARDAERLSGLQADFYRRSREISAKCSIREMYHCLVNLEYYPEILPAAEQFVRRRLERSMAALNGNLRPIPSKHYSHEVLDNWVHLKHREQVDEYKLLKGKTSVAKDAFIDATVQLAPLILIDGAWLQGMLNQNSIQTEAGRILFQILYEEGGEGDYTRHHANIYRDLLRAMGMEPPLVEAKEFIDWAPLLETSFEIPVFWMSISCFPRHFMPEILGLNLAVELAGIGGQYMQARDTLRNFGLPTLFIDVHLADDNLAQGHTAKSLNAIRSYMDDIAAREGHHRLNTVWRRVWSGVRSTLPQIGTTRLVAHKVLARLGGIDEPAAPKIFID